MKDPHPRIPTVKRKRWRIDGHDQDVLVIHSGDYFIAVRYEHARAMVDAVHDLCDQHDREQREGVRDG